MKRIIDTGAAALLLLAILAAPFAAHAAPGARISYQRDVRPILEKNCIVCHACYDAPCQLKMESFEGLDRGASKDAVYKARTGTQRTTRLGIDATDTAGWRTLGFFSVIEGGATSLLYRMLELGKQNPPAENQPVSDKVPMGIARTNQCPTQAEFDKYQHRRMHEGMPFGMAPMSPSDLDTLQGWLEQGAPLDGGEPALTASARANIAAWEEFFNRSSPRDKLLARYLYEHLFVAHLYFEADASSGFFEIVRSKTAPGQPIVPVATRFPTDDPGGEFSYRIRPVAGAIVQKTHITYPFGPERLARYEAVFGAQEWTVSEQPPYGDAAAANPFQTFVQIPAKLRYQFMLDTAFYYVNCFIRGPVCLGNVATGVIDDHFFAMFQSPAADKFLTDPEYAARQIPELALDGGAGAIFDVRPDWLRAQQRYATARRDAYIDAEGAKVADIWDGDGWNPDAMLTIFRSEDNATVIRGLRGNQPKTVWVMDYPLLERIYYLLVVNFDVFGRADHQIGTRAYFDKMRVESEVNFLRFLPRAARKPLFNHWYRGGLGATWKTSAVFVKPEDESGPEGPAENAMADFLGRVSDKLRKLTGAAGDLSANCPPDNDARFDSPARRQVEAALRPLTTVYGANAPWMKFLPEITYVRVGEGSRSRDLAYTLMHNRAHKNVAFMFNEEKRFAPDEDDVTLLRGPVGAYPNFIFQVPAKAVGEFATQLQAVASAQDFQALVGRFGVRRTHPAFWDAFQFFSLYQARVNPIEVGIFDANRYENY